MNTKYKILMVLFLLMMVCVSDGFVQDYEVGFSPFYAFGTDNLKPGIGGKFFFNFMKKKPLVFSLDAGAYNTTTNSIHAGELSKFDDDYMLKWFEISLQFSPQKGFRDNRRISYVGGGIGYYLSNYRFGEDIKQYFDDNNILGSANITNEFGFHLKAGVNFWLSEKSYINIEAKNYILEPTIEFKFTDLNTLQYISKDESGSFGTTIISIGYGVVF